MSTRFFSHRAPPRSERDDAHLLDVGQHPGAGATRALSEPEALDQEQALLFCVLQGAMGAPMSFDELRGKGIEFPASVVSELELAGVAIDRCMIDGADGRRVVGVRLSPPRDRALATVPPPAPIRTKTSRRATVPPPSPGRAQTRPTAAVPPPTPDRAQTSPTATVPPPTPDRIGRAAAARATRPPPPEREAIWGPVNVYRTSPGLVLVQAFAMRLVQFASWGSRLGHAAVGRRAAARSTRRLLMLAASLACALVVAALVVTLSGHGHRRPAAAHAGETTPSPRRAATARRQASSPPLRHVTELAPILVSTVLAAELETQGHDLLLSGRSSDAVPVLRRALLATGKQLGECTEPSSQACLTYAYALYDLGRALRLSGHPAGAVPILERRLQIDNQRPVVALELQLARRQAR